MYGKACGEVDFKLEHPLLLTLEFRAMFIVRMSLRLAGKSEADGGDGHNLPANQPVTTVMRFSVSVPVLSEQMAVAPPMVSQAARTCKARSSVSTASLHNDSRGIKVSLYFVLGKLCSLS